MTPVADLALPYVVVGLDTRPPAVRLEAQGRVEPPDPLVVVARADEPVGVVRARFSDASGVSWLVGHERVDALTVRVEMPTVGVATGRGTLRLEVLDLACNATTLDWAVLIDRPRAYDVRVETRHTQDVLVVHHYSYEVSAIVGASSVVSLSPDHSYEVVQYVRRSRDMEVTVDGR